MQRISIKPRPDWQKRVERLGLIFHSLDGAYWDESAYYQFSALEINRLEAATQELQRICLEAVERVLQEDLFHRLHIPDQWIPLIRKSWEEEHLALYGRFDLWFDGIHPPKMYEYNADTPTSLLEASVVQWHWLEDRFPHADQFNSLHEQLIARWQESGLQIGWSASSRCFIDLEGEPIRKLFKLYPWEWMIREGFSQHLFSEPWQLIEPAWKMILSNKAILPILWEMFPGHPNLLPSFFSPESLGNSWVRKPIFGREGANITLRANGNEVTTDGDYDKGAFIFQALQMPPNFDGNFPVVGSWIARDEAAGIGIRESNTPVTRNTSRFLPHLFV